MCEVLGELLEIIRVFADIADGVVDEDAEGGARESGEAQQGRAGGKQ